MQTKPKSNSVVTHGWNPETGELTFNVLAPSGALAPIVLRWGDLHADNIARAARHGMIQRVADKAAIDRDTGEGTPDEKRERMARAKHARMAALVEHYNSGAAEWSPARAESTGPRIDMHLVRAIAATQRAAGKPNWDGDDAAILARITGIAQARGVGVAAYMEQVRVARADVRDEHARMIAAATGLENDDLGLDD